MRRFHRLRSARSLLAASRSGFVFGFVLGLFLVFVGLDVLTEFCFQFQLRNPEVYLFFVSADLVQFRLILWPCLVLVFVKGALLHLWLGAPLGPRTLDRDLRWRRRRRIRLEEGPRFFRSGQAAVNQLEENLVDDFAVRREVRSDAHLLHERVRNALLCLRPNSQELVIAFFNGCRSRSKTKPENRFWIIAREELEARRRRQILLGQQHLRKTSCQGVKAVPFLHETRAKQ